MTEHPLKSPSINKSAMPYSVPGAYGSPLVKMLTVIVMDRHTPRGSASREFWTPDGIFLGEIASQELIEERKQIQEGWDQVLKEPK